MPWRRDPSHFVVSRVNPSRFIEGELPALEDLLQTMVKRTRGLKPDEIKSEDLDRPAGMPPEEE